jgi:hypothetical protein
MSSHKFKVGQMVDFDFSPRSGAHRSGPGYKILGLVPYESGEFHYRIKTIEEPFERIVRESELALVSSRGTSRLSLVRS